FPLTWALPISTIWQKTGRGHTAGDLHHAFAGLTACHRCKLFMGSARANDRRFAKLPTAQTLPPPPKSIHVRYIERVSLRPRAPSQDGPGAPDYLRFPQELPSMRQ